MAPVTQGSAKPSSAATAVSSQRTIASFFGAGTRSGVFNKVRNSELSGADKKDIVIANVPSEAGFETPPHSSPSKRPRVCDIKSKSKDERESNLQRTSVFMDSTKSEKNPASTKNADWLFTPSPSEPAKVVTKTFGRRDRRAMKSGVVAPVFTSAESPEQTHHGKPGRGLIPPESLVGKRLKVFWPLDKAWYSGRVKSYSKAHGSHVIKYDDGEEESVTLDKERVQWLEEAESLAAKPLFKRTHGHSTGKKSTPSSSLKRKAVGDDEEDDEKDEEEDVDSLLDELKNVSDDDVRSKTPTKRKRLSIVREDSPAKLLTVSSDIFDEVDFDIPVVEQNVTVRKRLRKQVRGRSTVREIGDVEDIDHVELEDGVEDKEGKASTRSEPLKTVVTSVRCLQLDEGAGDMERVTMLPGKSKAHPKAIASKETSSPSSRETDSDRMPPIAKKTSTGNTDSCPEKFSGSKAEKPQSNDFFAKLGATSRKIAGGESPHIMNPTPPTSAVDIYMSSKDLHEEKLIRGELHSTLVGEYAERFGGRVEEKFKFLGKARKDASGRRPTDPDFDARTLLLPADFVKGLTGGQRQWWEFKSKHMDKVLLFKMGKFYELFEMDAHVGAQELDLQYMKGDQPHCGFPEKLYFECAEKLARKGYRVLVIEQTETPDQLEQRKRDTGSKDKVVKREICAVLTKGTIVDGEMLTVSPDAAYLMSITEMPFTSTELSRNVATIGVCFVDTSTSHIMLGQFDDDSARSRLRSVLSELRPVELVKPRGVLTEPTERALNDHTRQPLINYLIPGKEFWDAKKSLKEIQRIYTSVSSPKNPMKPTNKSDKKSPEATEQCMLPGALQQVVASGSRGEAALSALGGVLFYLREALLDQTLFRLGRIDLLQGSDPFPNDGVLPAGSSKDPNGNQDFESNGQPNNGARMEPHMSLDSAALENLEILENNHDGGTSGTLFSHLDSCVTPYGRRLLRQWLVRPLLRVESIQQRQNAILDLKNVAAEAAINFQKELKGQSDIERLLSRLHASSGASGRNADNVVLYEDAAKKQLQEFMGALRGCRALLLAIESFQSCSSELSSCRLQNLVTPGLGVPDMTSVLEHFETSFDREEAEKTGRIVPHPGVDEDFDEADSAVKDASKELADYLVKQRKKFGNSSEIKYVTVGKEAYQMEIPEHFHAKVPASYEVRSSRKGFRRYWTPEIKGHLQDLTAGEQKRELALRGILQGLVKRFCEDYSKWLALVKCVAEIDVLISLSKASVSSTPTCLPTFVDGDFSTNSSLSTPKIIAKDIRHPIVSTNLAGGGAFVPNDITIGGHAPPFMLLTGPNMGGKSTLIRQICLAVVMAQVGANVTAEHFELSPVDRVFVRMGAKDHIMAGQSTFLVELSETASMLRSATARSLVALDELGRGTSTSDGQAIAHSVLQHLAHNVGCRGMFSTHYHRLATTFSSDNKVGLHHMSCKVGNEVDGVEEVTFLYKLAVGACPKSYGVNVARLAGMPEPVLRRASEKAGELEFSWEKDTVIKSEEDSKGDNGDSDMYERASGIQTASKVLQLLKKFSSNGDGGGSFESLVQVWHETSQPL